MLLNNFFKGLFIIFDNKKSIFNIDQVFRYICEINIDVVMITIICYYINNLKIFVYIYLLRLFIKNIIGNLFLNLTLNKLLSQDFTDNKTQTIISSKKESFKSLITTEVKILVYSKFNYLIDVILTLILPFYNVYFYGKYLTEIYLNIKGVDSRVKEKYLSQLCFFRLGIGLSFSIFLFIINTFVDYIMEDSLICRLILKDSFFNILYAMFIKSFQHINNLPFIENFSFSIPINIDFLYPLLCKIILKTIKNNNNNNKIPSKVLLKVIPYITSINDPFKFIPIKLTLEVYKDDIIKIIDILLKYEKIGILLNENVLSFALSFWINKEFTKFLLRTYNNINYELLTEWKHKISKINPQFFDNLYNIDEENILILDSVTNNSETQIFTTEINAPEIKQSFIKNLEFEYIENYFK